MAHKVLQPICLVDDEATTENSGLVLPSFTFAPFAGRKPMDEVPTDLVLIAKFYRHNVPDALHVSEPDVAHLLKTTVKREFVGKRGDVRLLQTPLLNSQGTKGRHVLLFGLGEQSTYGSRIACSVFDTFFRTALELGVRHVLVPFVPNPMSKAQLSHRATAYKLKHVLRQVLHSWDGPVNLTEVMAYCSPAAVRHIDAGFKFEQGEGCPCEGKRAK